MLLTDNNVKAELSYAYLHAVSARAGLACEVAGRHSDGAGVDAVVRAKERFSAQSVLTQFTVEIQLKATSAEPTIDARDRYSFSLEIDHYDKLRDVEAGAQQILVVLFLPNDPTRWLAHSPEGLIARRCAYWVSLRGAPESGNSSSQTVYVPRANAFSVEGLRSVFVSRSSVGGSNMSYKDLPENLVARINPIDARAYATASGWKRAYRTSTVSSPVYSHAKSDLDQLLIPIDSGMVDYGHRMAEAVVILAEDQGRPAAEVLNDLLMPPSDVLRFRVDEPETEAGVVPLVQGIGLLEGARRAILASACSVVQPQPFHPRLSRAEAEGLLQACRLGQTERGSFTAVIACPLDAVGGEPIARNPMPLFEGTEGLAVGTAGESSGRAIEPFTRKATGLLMRSVARIVSAVDADQVASLLGPASDQPPLSANLCEALAMMQPTGDRSRLTVQATWARTLPPPPSAGLPSVVQLRRDVFPVVEKLAFALRPAREPKPSHFIALVDALFGNPDEHNRVSGEVQLLVFDSEEGSFRARVSLNADDYQIALETHGVAGYVSLNGVLKLGGRVHHFENVSNFRLPERLDGTSHWSLRLSLVADVVSMF